MTEEDVLILFGLTLVAGILYAMYLVYGSALP
jgi:hypothetical protein